jgi:hypothetical protein
MLIIIANTLLDFKWYLNLIILFVIYVFTSETLLNIYSFFFGWKSKPKLSLSAGGKIRHNLYIIDALITSGLGLILYLISNLF